MIPSDSNRFLHTQPVTANYRQREDEWNTIETARFDLLFHCGELLPQIFVKRLEAWDFWARNCVTLMFLIQPSCRTYCTDSHRFQGGTVSRFTNVLWSPFEAVAGRNDIKKLNFLPEKKEDCMQAGPRNDSFLCHWEIFLEIWKIFEKDRNHKPQISASV